MTNEAQNLQETETQNLNLVSDETSIYESGQLRPINIKDLLGNEVATRQLINTLNLANREKETLKTELESYKVERASATLMPVLVIVLSVINILGAILVGLGANYLGLPNSPPYAIWILIIGVVLSLLSAGLNPFLPKLLESFRKGNKDAAKE